MKIIHPEKMTSLTEEGLVELVSIADDRLYTFRVYTDEDTVAFNIEIKDNEGIVETFFDEAEIDVDTLLDASTVIMNKYSDTLHV